MLPVIGIAGYAADQLAVAWHIPDRYIPAAVGAVVGALSLCALVTLRDTSRSRKRLVSTQRLDDLRSLSPSAFEDLVLAAYQGRGYSGALTQKGADGGVDIVLARDGERVYVQCKRWRQQVVRTDAVRSLKGVMAGDGVPRGIFVTSGRFTAEARRVAASYGIQTVDGMQLLDLVREALGEVTGLIDSLRSVGPHRAGRPSCPRCHELMVMRTGVNGTFWGCPRFPSCRGTLSVAA
jgi:restriction system protein